MQLEGTPNEDGLGAPLKVDHKIIGVIFLQSYVKGIHYTAQDDEILASVAKYIATALTRFRALEAERERTTELAIINIVQSGLAAGLELQAIIDLVGDTLREALVSSNIVINLYDEKTNLLSYLYAYEQGAPLTIAPQPPHPDGVFEKLIKTHDTSFLRYGGKLGESASALPGSVACKSGLAVPIVINDSIQGAVHVEDFKREYVYGESELRLLTTVAASLGAALENIRLSNQRNEAIEALRQSEEKFRRIVSSLPQFISIWDMNMECNYVSPSVYNLTGYTPDERLALRKEEYIPPESIPTFDKILKEELAREHSPDWDPNKVITFDLEEIRKDGSRLILESTFTFLRDATGAPVAILSISADITEQKRAEIELRESEEKLRSIFENAFDGICIYEEFPDEDRRVLLECNERYCQMAGRSKEELLAVEDTRTFQHIIENAPEEQDWESVKAGKAFSGIFSWIRPDGKENIIEYNAAPTKLGDRYFTIGMDRDITERRQAEQALRESEEKLHLIFENAFDGISIYEEIPSQDKRILLECNERYCQMAGRSKEELLAAVDTRTFQLIVENVPEERRFESIKTGKVFSGNFSWIRPDGKENIIEYNAAPTKLGDRHFTIGMDRDITERRQAEQALRESEEKLHLIFENAFDGISIYEEIPSQDKRILLECNERYCQMAGRSKEELLAVEDTRVIQRDLGIDAERFLWERIIAGKAFPGVFTWIRPDGKENVIEYNAAPTRVGDRYFTIGLDRDVTERKQNEQRLRESEQRLMDIINFLPIATMVTDQDGRVTAWNQAMEEITGVMSEDIVGRGNYEYALPFYSKRLPILIDLVNLPEDELDARYSYVRRRGGILTAESVCDLLGKKERLLVGFASALSSSDGQIRGAIESIEDVTDQRQTEIELKKAKEAAESANRSKSVFLANMSHEIRTPMNAILGFTQLMQRDSDLSSRQREHLDIINRSGEHLLALINDILELSKIEAGRATFMPVNFDLHKLLADLEVMFRVRTDEKKLRLLLEMADDVPQWMIADEGKLRQVLINLIGNAVKFTEEGGIGIRVGIQSDQTQKKSLLIEVEDTGPGILPEEVEKLFKPFEQASSGIKMGGTGLGLALSQGFVQIMGGTITISSIIGQGSTFRFSIPFDEGKEDSSKHKETKKRVVGLKPGQGDIRVLIADDRETNRQILTQMLSSVGFKIHEVTNGIEVIEEFHTWNPQIILMDMRMPVMDGYEATRKIKEDVEGKKTMIIAVTASAFQEDRQRIMAAGADGYISKPFKETDLFETIRRLTHVIYLYESDAVEEQATVSDDDLIWQKAVAALPADLVGECREVAENADIFRLLELITDLSKINVKIGRRLNDLAQRYAYEEIVNLLTVGE